MSTATDADNGTFTLRDNLPLLLTFGVGIVLWFCPHPEGISEEGWKLFSIFAATIVGIITRPLPMGAVAVASLGIVTGTGVLSIGQALGGYSNGSIWLIAIAFFVARGFVKTRLGTRIAYYFVMLFGRKTVGLAYSFGISEMILAPAIPSVTARAGGIIYPIVNSLCHALGSTPESEESARKLGRYLILCCFQFSVIAGATFMTGMAANPIAVALAKEMGVTITWAGWAAAAIVPSLITVAIMPIIIFWASRPTITDLPDARRFAREKLDEMGPMSRAEWILVVVFTVLVGLWATGEITGMHTTTAAMLGVTVLLVTKVITWGELLEEKSAWGTLVWFGALLTLASYLNEFGVVAYFSDLMATSVDGLSWPVAFAILALVYYYSHYFFASAMAHIGAMFAAFLTVAIVLGTPPMLAALVLVFFSALFGGLTHYGIGSAPVLFGSGYVHTREWWKVGFIVSVFYILIWGVLGLFWWKFLGMW